jgi:hypothetical protein
MLLLFVYAEDFKQMIRICHDFSEARPTKNELEYGSVNKKHVITVQ